MEKEKVRQRGFPLNAIRVCIDQYNGEPQGRVYSKMNKEPLQFENCCEMLVRTDKLFDRCGYPQSFQDKKDFQGNRVMGQYQPPRSVMTDEEIYRQQGKVKTVDICVRSRRNASWQGSILYENGMQWDTFESVEELLQCMSKKISPGFQKEAPPGSGASPPEDLQNDDNKHMIDQKKGGKPI